VQDAAIAEMVAGHANSTADAVATSTSTVVPATPPFFLGVAAPSGCIPLNSGYRLRERVEHFKRERTRALVVFGGCDAS
jgi:hypothetical protein